MKQALWISVLLVIALFAALIIADAGVPELMNYQGRLTDAMGNPLDTTISMTFAIYDDSTGGNPIWTETHPDVEVVNGLFSVTTEVGIELDIGEWLGITVGDDPEIEPLTHLVSAPYAFQAKSVSGDITTDSARVVIGDPAGNNIVVSATDGYSVSTADGDTIICGQPVHFEIFVPNPVSGEDDGIKLQSDADGSDIFGLYTGGGFDTTSFEQFAGDVKAGTGAAAYNPDYHCDYSLYAHRDSGAALELSTGGPNGGGTLFATLDGNGYDDIILRASRYSVADDSSGFELFARPDTAGFSVHRRNGFGHLHNEGLDYLYAADVGSNLRMSGTGSDGQGILQVTAGGFPNGYDDVILRGNFLSQYGDSAEFALRADENGSSLVLTDPQGDTAVTISSDGTIHATGAIRSGNTLVLNGPDDELLAPSGEMFFGRENPPNTFDPDVKVGVGTKTPSGRLEVYGTTDPARSLLILHHLTTNPTQVLDTVFKIRSDTYGYTFLTMNGGGVIQQFQSGTSPANQFNPSGDSYFNATGGRLGVGTSTPSSSYALHVEGQDRGLYSIATQGSSTVRPYGVTAGLNTTNSVTTGGGLQVSINHGTHAPNISYVMGGDYTLTRGTGTHHLIGTRVQIDGEAAGDYGIQLQVEDPGYAIYSVNDGPSYFNGKVGIGTSVPKAKLHSTTSTIVGAANAAAADSDLGNSQVNVYVDETLNQLCFKVKYSDGTIKTGCIPLF